MKLNNFIVVIVVVFIAFAYFTSCEDKISEPDKNISSFVNPYAYVGEVHNEGLDYILNDLNEEAKTKKNKLNKIGSKQEFNSELIKFVNNSQTKFLTSKGYQPEEISSILGSDIFNYCKKMGKVNDDSLITLYSEKQIYYLNIVNEIIETENDLENLKIKLNKLEEQVFNELGDEEAMPILIATSVALNSSIYWEENYQIWENTMLEIATDGNLGKVSNLGKISKICALKDVIGMDVAGAVAGAMAGGGKGALIGGLAGSAGQAIYEIFLWLCDILGI
ncbi:MAG: hypothetical protein JW866_09855 [Ignavibacteriales bacterium]|nr:hypothetical protein [Ignavibacteriales bacterium]